MCAMGGVLAIDYGERKCGFAYADRLRISMRAFPLARAEGEALLAHVARLLEEFDVAVILVGLPFHMDGSEGPRARAVRAFGARLATRFPAVRLCFHDERLTTKEAEGLLAAEGLSRRAIKREKDGTAALVLLRDWVLAGEPGAS